MGVGNAAPVGGAMRPPAPQPGFGAMGAGVAPHQQVQMPPSRMALPQGAQMAPHLPQQPAGPPTQPGGGMMQAGGGLVPPAFGGVPRPLVGGALPGGAPAASPGTSPVLGNTQNIQAQNAGASPGALAAALGRMGAGGGFNRTY